MKAGTVYIEQEARQFGIENRVKVRRQAGAKPEGMDPVLYEPATTFVLSFPVLRARLWAYAHGYGWVPVL